MVQYIYFVKCPNCEDEPFDFFDEAKNFAIGCISKKPIITQIEVCRNDFGECTDSNDLGTVWSWEDMMTDAEPTKSVFTKDDLKPWIENDPEFAALDNSVDFEPETPEVSAIDDIPDNFRKPVTEESVNKFVIVGESNDYKKQFYNVDSNTWVSKAGDATLFDDRNDAIVTLSDLDTSEFYTTSVMIKPAAVIECSERKPIPEGMTIESLVEEMEENEDMVECKVCNDLYPKEDCHYETDMGYLCPTCKKGIKSRGETLTFEEDYSEDSDEFYDDDFYDDDAGITDKDMVRYDMEYDIARDRRYFGEAKNKANKIQTVAESVTKERINKMTKSELRTMIREMLHEELSLKEEIKEIVDEDGVFSSLNRAVMDNLCDIVICRRKGAPTNSNDDNYYKSDNWISTVPTNKLYGQRKEMDNGLTTRFTYLLAGGIPKDVDPTKDDKIKKGLAELRDVYPEDQYKDNRIKYEHKVYTETKGDTQDLYYSVLLIPNYKEGYHLQSRDFPSLLRGQAEGPNYWKNVASQKRR